MVVVECATRPSDVTLQRWKNQTHADVREGGGERLGH